MKARNTQLNCGATPHVKALVVAVALIALQYAGAQTKTSKVATDGERPPALSKEFQSAGQLALEAIKRVDEARAEPSVSYEPRRLDAEKAVSETKRKAKTAEDKHVYEVLYNFLDALGNERRYSGDRASKAGADYWEAAIFPCAVEADWYFGETLTDKGIEMAKTSTCAASSRPKRK